MFEPYIGQELSGKRVNEILDGVPLIKFTRDNDTHYGMKYKTGLNVDILPFKPSGKCSEGGIYVSTLIDFFVNYEGYGSFARLVKLPDDARVYVEPHKLKCNKVILGWKKQKIDMIRGLCNRKNNEKNLLEMVKRNCHTIKFIKPKFWTEEMMLEVIKQDSFFLTYFDQKYRTNRIMLEAVKNNGLLLKFIDQGFRTNEIMLEAVKNNGDALEYIDQEFRTNEIMLEAVKQNGVVMRMIDQKFRTNEIMIEAVKNNGMAICEISQKYRTNEIMIEAIKQNFCVLGHIKQKIYDP